MAAARDVISLISGLFPRGWLIICLMLAPQSLQPSFYAINPPIQIALLPNVASERAFYSLPKLRLKKTLRSLLAYLD